MPLLPPVQLFFETVRRSGLVDSARLAAMADALESAAEPVTLEAAAQALVDQGHVTAWQVDKLKLGKYKGFFLGKYRLLGLLGKGGMSSVYLADHILMKRRCAIKVLPTKRVNDTSYLGRFRREAQAVAALNHPNIVKAYDIDHQVDKDAEIHFMVMEYVAGPSLLEIVHARGPLPFAEAADYIRQGALGLQHAHDANMVHRDIKPGNLLVDGYGEVKLLDLGLARFFSDDEDNEQAGLTIAHGERVLGTADYLAPEQAIDSHNVDARADIYSLGGTLYFLLTGHAPFPEGSMAQRLLAHQTKEPTPIAKNRPDAPAELVAIVSKMMAKRVDDRYQTADDVADALQDWIDTFAGPDWENNAPPTLQDTAAAREKTGLSGRRRHKKSSSRRIVPTAPAPTPPAPAEPVAAAPAVPVAEPIPVPVPDAWSFATSPDVPALPASAFDFTSPAPAPAPTPAKTAPAVAMPVTVPAAVALPQAAVPLPAPAAATGDWDFAAPADPAALPPSAFDFTAPAPKPAPVARPAPAPVATTPAAPTPAAVVAVSVPVVDAAAGGWDFVAPAAVAATAADFDFTRPAPAAPVAAPETPTTLPATLVAPPPAIATGLPASPPIEDVPEELLGTHAIVEIDPPLGDANSPVEATDSTTVSSVPLALSPASISSEATAPHLGVEAAVASPEPAPSADPAWDFAESPVPSALPNSMFDFTAPATPAPAADLPPVLAPPTAVPIAAATPVAVVTAPPVAEAAGGSTATPTVSSWDFAGPAEEQESPAANFDFQTPAAVGLPAAQTKLAPPVPATVVTLAASRTGAQVAAAGSFWLTPLGQKLMIPLAAVVGGSVALLLFVGVYYGLMGGNSAKATKAKPKKKAAAPETVVAVPEWIAARKVTIAASGGQFTQLQPAIDGIRDHYQPQDRKDRLVVEIAAGTYRESVVCDGSLSWPAGVEIRAMGDVKWAGVGSKPAFTLKETRGLTLHGLAFDGAAHDTVIEVFGMCPGLTLSQLRLDNIRKTGVLLRDATGLPGSVETVITLRDVQLWTKPGATALRATGETLQALVLERCQLSGGTGVASAPPATDLTVRECVFSEGDVGLRFESELPQHDLRLVSNTWYRLTAACQWTKALGSGSKGFELRRNLFVENVEADLLASPVWDATRWSELFGDRVSGNWSTRGDGLPGLSEGGGRTGVAGLTWTSTDATAANYLRPAEDSPVLNQGSPKGQEKAWIGGRGP